MKPTGQRWHIHNQHQLRSFTDWIQLQWDAGIKPTLQLMAQDRTTSQNSHFYALYGELARQSDDQSTLDVRRHCKLVYGVGILKAADPDFADLYDRTVKKMSFEDKLLIVGYMDVTSKFNKSQGTEYIDTIIHEYSKQGFVITHPTDEGDNCG